MIRSKRLNASVPFEIYDASTASYGKKVSSTYQRYACGTFLPYSLYLHRLFQKAYGKIYGYGVAAHKLIFNVSERTGMSGVPRNGDVFAPQKLAFRSVHGCTLLDRLFQKAYGEVVSAQTWMSVVLDRSEFAVRTRR